MQKNSRNAQKLPRTSFSPYPELVERTHSAGGWSVLDSNDHPELPSNGITNKVEKKLYAPFSLDGIGIALHELAHVKWSPQRFPKVRHPLIVLQAVEDARINLGLVYLGMPVTLDRESIARVAHMAASEAKDGQIAVGILRTIASLGTQAEMTMREELETLPPYAARLARYWVDQTETRLVRAREAMGPGNAVAPFRVARQIARDLARDLKRQGLISDDLTVAGVGCCVSAIPCADDEDTGFLAKRRATLRRLRERNRAEGLSDKEASPGRMKFARPMLTIRQPKVRRPGTTLHRAATEGAHVVRPDRLLLDRAIFSRPGTQGGGTVLIDTSGSMSLSAEEVESIVRAAGGGALVAIYSGSDAEGELRIVARADWRAANKHLERFGMGNIVDLPALKWLATQPEPRWWISDTGVTGIGDEPTAAMFEACSAVVERGRIRQVDNVQAFLDAED